MARDVVELPAARDEMRHVLRLGPATRRCLLARVRRRRASAGPTRRSASTRVRTSAGCRVRAPWRRRLRSPPRLRVPAPRRRLAAACPSRTGRRSRRSDLGASRTTCPTWRGSRCARIGPLRHVKPGRGEITQQRREVMGHRGRDARRRRGRRAVRLAGARDGDRPGQHAPTRAAQAHDARKLMRQEVVALRGGCSVNNRCGGSLRGEPHGRRAANPGRLSAYVVRDVQCGLRCELSAL